jgi:hypothetical protein
MTVKAKQREINKLAMLEAYRQVFGTDAPAVVVLALERSRKARDAVERVYAETLREHAEFLREWKSRHPYP